MPYMVSYRFICGGCGTSVTPGYTTAPIGSPAMLPHVPTGWGRWLDEIYCGGCCANRIATVNPTGEMSLLTNRAMRETADAAT